MGDNFPPDESAVKAAVLLMLHELAPDFEPLQRTEAEIVGITGADQAQACALRDQLMAALPQLIEEERTDPYKAALAPVCAALDKYFDEHPGSFELMLRREYSSEYRSLVVRLLDSPAVNEIPISRLASACGITVETLIEWLGSGQQTASPPRTSARKKPGRQRRRRAGKPF